MSRHIQNTTSSSCLNPKDPGFDESPISNNAQSPIRARKLRKRLPPLKVPNDPKEPYKSPVKQETFEVIEMTEAVSHLFFLETLPPLSPEGLHFAICVREGSFKYADVAGEWLFQLLQDNLPGYEEHAGETKARAVRKNIELLRRGDPKEVRAQLNLGFEYEPVSKWSAHEKGRASKYPMALGTTGVAEVIPTAQHVSARGGSERHSSSKVSEVTKCSAESSWSREKTGYSTDCGADSPTCLSTSDISDYESSHYESEEYDSASEDRLPDDMFPYQRYREDF